MTIKETHCPESIAFNASLAHLEDKDPEIATCIQEELTAQRSNIKLIASENYSSLAVQLAMGNWLTDKYAEGYPFHRFYGGCARIDRIEQIATDRAKKLFKADHAYVQPHSGADANLVAFWSLLVARVQDKEIERLGRKNLDALSAEEYDQIRTLMNQQKLMGMDLGSGGHLTHGYRHNISSKMMRAVSYGVDPKTGLIDYDVLAKKVRLEKPDILLAGYSAYPRKINFALFKELASEVGAHFMVDMAHFAGLVAGDAFEGDYTPVPFADIVTTTTHKTLRGPRGGMILCKDALTEHINKGCPLVLGGPLPHVMAAKAIAFKEALQPSFKDYAKNVIQNAQALAKSLMSSGIKVLTGGTDNHLVLFDVRSFGLTGRQAETLLEEAHLTVNRNAIPNDPNGPWYTSGIRIGTPAITSLGMKSDEMREIASMIVSLLQNAKPSVTKSGAPSKAKASVPDEILQSIRSRVKDLLKAHPLYPELSL